MRLKLEELESRCLLSASAMFTNGVLRVEGTNLREAFTLKLSSGNLKLSLSTTGQSWSFPAAAVSRVEANLYGGDDNWNGLATGYRGSQLIRGGAGRDAITTGEGNDTIFGDDGDDSLIPWAGQDVVYGGAGNDWIALSSGDGSSFGHPVDVAYGGIGDDELLGGSHDRLFGEDGNDKLTASGTGVVGGTYMDGGNGNDVFYARQGLYRAYDTIIGGAGYDRLVTYDILNGQLYEYLHGIEQIG